MPTDVYSDIDLQDPVSYYGGFKAARIEQFGDAERVLSDPWTGEWRGGQYRFRVNDMLRDITRRKASPTERFWTTPLTVRMITRAARAVLETPWTVWVGPIIDAQPQGLSWDITLGDIVSQTLLSDAHQLPWRLIRDGFLTTVLDEINPELDLEQPEPIIYGEHRRVAGIDLASPEGFCYKPAYLGKRTVDGTQYHVWLGPGHACKQVDMIRVDDAETHEGADWLIPTEANHTAAFGTSWEDITSSTFGNLRRYTLVHGVVGNTIPDACAAGDSVLTISLQGIETIGDGTGSLITDRFLQFKHFCINFVAHNGADSYQAGAWLTNPTWAIYDANVPIVDSYSFDDCAAIGVARLPDSGGYTGAAIIGANGGDQSSVRRWIADWNRSCGCQFGITHRGRIKITLLHPTEDIKAAATLYTDATEILDGSFSTAFDWDGQANHIRFRADYEYSTGQWRTDGVAIHVASVDGYGAIPSPLREYPFAPGITMTNHLAVLESRIRAHPPQLVTLEATIGPNPVTLDSLGYAELGSYLRYRHFEGVTEEAEIRLGQVISHVVRTGQRRVRVTVLDCEDLIGFDAFEGEEIPPEVDEEVVTGATYYVSLSGSDANDGLTLSTPKRTIAAGVALLSPGDMLYIRGGTYTTSEDVIDSALYTVPSGTSWAVPVIIAGYPGETVVLQPPNNTHALRLTTGAPSYLVVKDLTLDYVNDSTDRECLYLNNGAHHNRFRRLDVKNGSNFGIVFSDNVANSPFNEVLDCEVHGMGDPAGTDITRGHGFYILSSDNLFKGNHVHDNEGYGFHLYENSGPLNVARNVVRQNRIHDNGLNHSTAYGVIVAYGADNLVYNNLIYDNNSGIFVYANSSNTGVYHNTIVNNVNDGITLQSYASAPTIRNNIVFGNGAGIVDAGGTGTPVIDHNVTTDPLFVNEGAKDFHLTASSPARDAGTTVADVATDYDDAARPQGLAYCIGAFEYV